jgi:hypothetical protein
VFGLTEVSEYESVFTGVSVIAEKGPPLFAARYILYDAAPGALFQKSVMLACSTFAPNPSGTGGSDVFAEAASDLSPSISFLIAATR